MITTNADRHGAPMTLDRLRVLLSAYGAAPCHWPQAERAAAEALIDSSTDARALVAEAAQLDALLDMVGRPAPSAALAERVRNRRFGWRGLRAVILGERFAADARRWMLTPRHQAVALASALVVGVLVGAELPAGVPWAQAPAHIATADSNPGRLVVESMAGRGAPLAMLAPGDRAFSSNGDPSFDAPDPFGAAAHGMDLVDGGRINSVPVPASGEPFGSIPLL